MDDPPSYEIRIEEHLDERVNTVFAVKLQIPNSDSELKPGMPADATLK